MISLAAISLGVIIGLIAGLFPGLHVYNVMGFILVFFASKVSTIWLINFAIAVLVTYTFSNTLSSVFLSLPDESTAFMLLPAAKFLRYQRGYEAVVLTNTGGLFGVMIFALSLYFFREQLTILHTLIKPYIGGILLTILIYLVISEWPKSFDREEAGIKRFFEAFKSIGAGLIVWITSGILGFYVLNATYVSSGFAFQGLLAVFVGLFAAPMLIFNIVSNFKIPQQKIPDTVETTFSPTAIGVLSGLLGGSIAAYLPIVTGGIGGVLAGHTTATRSQRAFMIGYGASKVIYYVGALLLFFLPTLTIRRGGMAWMLTPFVSDDIKVDLFFYLIILTIVVAGIAFLLTEILARILAKNIHKVNVRLLSTILLILLVIAVGYVGKENMFYTYTIFLTSTGIGLFATLFNTRRINCMGVLLIPVTLNMLGLAEPIKRLLGI